VKDAWMTMNCDRSKYNFVGAFFANHQYAALTREMASRDHPDDARVIFFLKKIKNGGNFFIFLD
jgi:hypothetical protein